MIPDRATGQGEKYSWNTDLSVEEVNEYFSSETFLEEDSKVESLHQGRDYHVDISKVASRTNVEVVYQGEDLPHDEVLETWKEQTSEYDLEKRNQEDNLASHIL